MVYPIIVVFVMLAVVGFMIVQVLPQVRVLYDGLGGGVQLPILTRILLAISDLVIRFWWIVLLVTAFLAFAEPLGTHFRREESHR
jgi:type II secretory pathway component PulF